MLIIFISRDIGCQTDTLCQTFPYRISGYYYPRTLSCRYRIPFSGYLAARLPHLIVSMVGHGNHLVEAEKYGELSKRTGLYLSSSDISRQNIRCYFNIHYFSCHRMHSLLFTHSDFYDVCERNMSLIIGHGRNTCFQVYVISNRSNRPCSGLVDLVTHWNMPTYISLTACSFSIRTCQ